MKRWIVVLTCISITSTSLPVSAESLQDYARQTDALYRKGGIDGIYTKTATSMLGWGLGLTIGIAIVAAVVHQSTAN